MRSLIILEVEHGEDTEYLEYLDYLVNTARRRTNLFKGQGYEVDIVSHTVRVDILDPNCNNEGHVNPPEGF